MWLAKPKELPSPGLYHYIKVLTNADMTQIPKFFNFMKKKSTYTRHACFSVLPVGHIVFDGIMMSIWIY